MNMNKNSGGSLPPLDPVPQGNHLGILYAIIALGTQERVWQGEKKYSMQAQFIFELPHLMHEFEDKQTGQKVMKPRVISRDYTLSAAEKSGLRQMIEGWCGRKFSSDDEAAEFDLRAMLGKPCFVSVTHVAKDGKTYANIGAITNIVQGFPVPPQFNASQYLDFDAWDWTVFQKQPKWIQEKIEKSPEFKSLAAATGYVKPTPKTSGHADGLPAPERTATGQPVKTWNQAPPAPPVPPQQAPAAGAGGFPAAWQTPAPQPPAPPAWPIPDAVDDVPF